MKDNLKLQLEKLEKVRVSERGRDKDWWAWLTDLLWLLFGTRYAPSTAEICIYSLSSSCEFCFSEAYPLPQWILDDLDESIF